MRKTVIGVMGPASHATLSDLDNAYQLGQLIATQGWILLTGGRKAGVMDAANHGAKAVGGLTLGILPTARTDKVSDAVDIAIFTDMGNSRNNINGLSSDVLIACGMGLGTASEVALALKNGQPVILLGSHATSQAFFSSFAPEQVFLASTPKHAIELVSQILAATVP